MPDSFDLARFVEAQDTVMERVLFELRAGRKRTHWMWFVFPQLRGLGRSPMAQHFGIESLLEARAYLAHPILGPRLRECTEILNSAGDLTAHQVFGSTDDRKFRSSMTLFWIASGGQRTFADAILRYYGGEPDPATFELLGMGGLSDNVP